MLSEMLKKNNYLVIYLIVIGIINLILQTLPLTNVFGYEFSALNALLLSVLSGLFSISLLKSLHKENKKFSVADFISALRWMIFLPFTISIVKSIIFGFCSFTDGLLFYLVITFPSVLIGSAIAFAVFYLIKKFKIISFIVLYLLILFISVLEIYLNPQIYLYNPLFAYFPGTIYDEGLSVDLKLILYRIFNLILFVPVLIYFFQQLSNKTSTIKNIYFLFLVVGISAVFYFWISPVIGFTTTESRLKDELSINVESQHFVIQADSRIEKEVLQQLVLNQEYYYTQLRNLFSDEPENKINSFLFFDSEQKKNLFGSAAADVAKPWLNSIYVSCDTWENTLRHEISHCFTADFGTGVFKLAAGFNPALIEGVAEAADGFYDENNIHHLASLAYKNDYKIDIAKLFSGFSFFGSVSSLSYIYSGSFIKFLITEYGVEKVKYFYQNKDFKESFSTDIDSVVENYKNYLESIADQGTRDKANYYFGRKALISKVCPRYISSRLIKGWEFLYKKEFRKAESIFKAILSKSENLSSLIGLAKVYEEIDSAGAAINLLESNLAKYSGTSSEYDLKFRLAELYVKESKLDEAKQLYYFLNAAKPNRRLEILAATRISLLQNNNIGIYVSGSDYDRYEILKELNSTEYNYSSIPLMIDLSNTLKEDYKLFLQNFKNHLEVKDKLSSFAVYKLSGYMLKNFDYVNARKMAGFALRYKGDTNLLTQTEELYNKTEWFFRNADRVLNETSFKLKVF